MKSLKKELEGDGVLDGEANFSDVAERAEGAGGADVSVKEAQSAIEAADTEPAAGDRVQELEEALEAAVRTIEELEKKLLDVERAQQLERLLIEAGTVDLETAQILAERRLASTEASAHEVVQELVSTKGHLFRSPQRGITGSAVSGGPASATDSLSELAAEARRTGDRRAVLRYLRGRRG